jgi:hypothetical protein
MIQYLQIQIAWGIAVPFPRKWCGLELDLEVPDLLKKLLRVLLELLPGRMRTSKIKDFPDAPDT